VVTRYELTPAPGVKLTKIVSLADDLALVMKAASCHIVAPIPGKGRVGIDVPNTTTTVVYLKEIITAHEFTGNPSSIALPIGKDISGQAIVADLHECPHLLIAGATGSGKTVCLNSLLLGILTRASPEQVRFLMIDPKMVELSLFNEIPHLIAPVVTTAKKASVALHWAVGEMERRYQLLATSGVRNIDLYNRRLASRNLEPSRPSAGGEKGIERPGDDGKPLPYLVIVIDELADLMMVASQDVEGAITRLAQLSRAVGIHIILATQRPSVDVITGVIKANFPARIAFQVASKVDSRTILDANGADKLLGRGDLLFLRPGAAKPIRAQGAFVTDAEIEQVVNFLKEQRAPSYDERLLEHARQPEGALITEKDELYEMAKQLVLETGQASTSLLQRRLRLGYGRAARMLDLMEQEGLVGPPQGSRPREILVSREAVETRRPGGG
ncbi:MAG: DNA translocase FtsK, partial [Candidatus Omnitrophica bacterium]|nr:DNA translocase FtsK [Candidatus Omnitrophota bacterium]